MPTWQERFVETFDSLLGRARREQVDPFSALEVQISLARLETHIEQLLADERRFARGHHLRAARLAYDHLIEQACRMAGVSDLPQDPQVRRVLAEAELRSRGWTW